MISAIQKLEDGTISLTITIPSLRIEEVRKQVIDEYVKEAEFPGFRKGKAPKNLVEEKIDKDKLREEILKKVLPQTYLEATKEHNLNPIISPQVHVRELTDGRDWQYTALTCEAPLIDLGGYKDNIKKITAKKKIIIPGKKDLSAQAGEPITFDEISREVMEAVKITIPKLIVQGEVDRLLSQTLDEIKKLGMTLDQYLSSTGKTAEALRNEYETKATSDIKLEFTLQKIADSEKIQVTDSEIEKAIKEAKTEEERKSLEANKYLLATIIRQRKTLDFLRSL